MIAVYSKAYGRTVYARNTADAMAIAQNDRWITVHPNGKDAKGRPALIGDDGTVKGGMGGKFNGKKIGEDNKKVKTKLRRVGSYKSVAEWEQDISYAEKSIATHEKEMHEANKKYQSLIKKIDNGIGDESYNNKKIREIKKKFEEAKKNVESSKRYIEYASHELKQEKIIEGKEN